LPPRESESVLILSYSEFSNKLELPSEEELEDFTRGNPAITNEVVQRIKSELNGKIYKFK